MSEFKVYGPFQIPVKSGWIEKGKKLKEFWDGLVEEEEGKVGEEGLSEAAGCYIFAIKTGAGKKGGKLVPWYVGKAETAGFRGECFEPTKWKLYAPVIKDRKGTPHLFLVPKLTPTGRFSRPKTINQDDISFLEETLIGMALARNPELLNTSKTKLVRELLVPGIIQGADTEKYPGSPGKAAITLRETLGLTK